MSEQLPDWVMDLVVEIIAFEEDHPKLYEAGENVVYKAPLRGAGVPEFVDANGTLVGKVWCLDMAQRHIPDDIKMAARWYERGRHRGIFHD